MVETIWGCPCFPSKSKSNFSANSDIDLTIKTDGHESERLLFDVLEAIDELDLIYLFDISLFAEIENTDLLGHIARVGCEFYKHNPRL